MSVGTQIRDLRKKRRLNGLQLAHRAGLDPSYLSKLERGKAGWSAEGLEAIARELNTTPGALLDGLPGGAEVTATPRVPVIDFIENGLAPGVIPEARIIRLVYCELPDPTRLFAMEVADRSMEPEFRPGDIVIFRRDLQPLPGDFVAAIDPAAGGTFKRYKELSRQRDGGTEFVLVALNDDYASFRSDETDWKIVGTLVRHIRNYRK